MGLEFELDVSGLKAAFKAAEKNLEKNIPAALQQGAHIIAAHARQTHDYTSRTGLLEESTMAGDVQGSFSGGDLEVAISAGAPYALFVEEDTKAHEIRPKHKKALAWPAAGGQAGPFAVVHHPGTTGTHFLANAVEDSIDGLTETLLEDATALSFEQAGFEVDD